MLYVMYNLHYFPNVITERIRPIGEMFSFVGVPTFFLISGFLGGVYVERYSKSWKRFFVGKVKRILVPYWIVLVAVITIRLVLNLHAGIMDCFSAIFNLQGVFQLKWALPELGHTWFLSIIMVCYLLMPVFWGLCNKQKTGLLILSQVAFVAVIILFSMLKQTTSAVYTTEVFLYYLAFMFGRGIAVDNSEVGGFDSTFQKGLLRKEFLPWGGLLIIGMMGLRIVVRHFFDDSPIYILTVCVFILVTTIAYCISFCKLIEKVSARLNEKVFVAKLNHLASILDSASFEIYLVHALFVSGCLNLANVTGKWIVNIVVLTGLTIVMAAVLRWVSGMVTRAIWKE